MKTFFNLFGLSFRAQLIYGIGLSLALLISIFTYIETTINNNSTYSRTLAQSSEHSIVFASMVKVWIMSNDYVGLEEALENFSIYDNLLFASVVNMDGKIIAHTDKKLVGMYVSDERRILFLQKIHTQTEPKLELIENEYTIDVIRMIHNKDEHIGFVHIRFDQHTREKLISQRIYDGIFIGLSYLLTTLFLLYLIVSMFTKQLKFLLETVRKVHDGNKEVRADEGGYEELAQLSHEFNDMLDVIGLGERRLKGVKEQLEYAVNGTQDGLWDWNLETNEVYFSPRWKEMIGYKDDELPNIFESWENNMHPDDLEKAKQDITFSQEVPGRFYENIHRLRHKDGSWVWILTRGQTVFNDEGKAIRMLGFHTDITKQKQLENELLKQEELMIAQSRHVAMGEMIGMIAHQWRQPISIVAMGANNMLLDIELGELNEESVKNEADLILKQTKHLSKTIDDFRNFFRPNRDKDEVNVCDVILEAKEIVGKSFENNNIELIFTDTIDETILTYSRELLQVILNLLKNAKEAMESSNIKSAYIRVNVESIEDSIVITVSDNAGGIDEAVIGHIFEAYFSTKEAKNGTGLGLYMSKTIIDKHLHGTIVATNIKEGACFTIKLPKKFNGDKTK